MNAALKRRAALAREIEQVTRWAIDASHYQEGSEPPESAEQLRERARTLIVEHSGLVARINMTNAAVRLPSGKTITEALAARDALRTEHKLTLDIADTAATGGGRRSGYLFRSTRSELATVVGANVGELRGDLRQLAENLRLLDEEIEAAGFASNLTE